MGRKLHRAQGRLKHAEDKVCKLKMALKWAQQDADRAKKELEKIGPFGFKYRREFGDVAQFQVCFQPQEIAYRFWRNGRDADHRVGAYVRMMLDNMVREVEGFLVEQLTKDFKAIA